jgi:hypothetical protein
MHRPTGIYWATLTPFLRQMLAGSTARAVAGSALAGLPTHGMLRPLGIAGCKEVHVLHVTQQQTTSKKFIFIFRNPTKFFVFALIRGCVGAGPAAPGWPAVR